MVIAQAAVPLHPPPHPEKAEPCGATAVNTTAVPEVKLPVHVDPLHAKPDGLLVTLPSLPLI